MNLDPRLPDFALETILNFIRDFTKGRRVVVGLSGGLDSSVVLALCVRALDSDRILAVHMPDSVTPNYESEDAEKIAREWGVEYRVVNIDPILKKYIELLQIKDEKAIGNLKARIRMSILYGIANSESRLVAGTSNKSEILTGYFTKYGDGASDFAPIGDLYKTQVRELAKILGIPENIIKKKPSAHLVSGQYDEDELGVKYEILDRILYGLELGLKEERIAEVANVDLSLVKHVIHLYNNSRHKRVMLYIPKIAVKTVNTDWRE